MTKFLYTVLCLCLSSYLFSQPTIDGNTADAQYMVLGSAGSNNGFGNDNQLGSLKFFSSSTTLYVAVQGKLTSNDNIVVFMDFSNYNGRGASALGGSSSSSTGVFSTSTAPGDCSGNGGLNGAVLDAGFDPDYALAFNEGNGSSNFFLDAARFNSSGDANGYNTTLFVGQTPNQTGGSVSTALGLGGTGNITFAYRNDFDDASNPQRGIEFSIPYAALPGVSAGDQVRFFVVITNSFGFMSDESIPGTITGGNPGCDANLQAQASQLYTGLFTLPVNFTFTEAVREANAVRINWQVQETDDLLLYEIEHSTNGSSFHRKATVPKRSNSSTSYTFLDPNPGSGMQFYRIAAKAIGGSTRYSPVLRVNMSEGRSRFSATAVTSATIVLQLQDVAAGNYQLMIFSADGKVVATKTMMHDGKTRTLSVNTKQLSSGVYRVQLRGERDVFTAAIQF